MVGGRGAGSLPLLSAIVFFPAKSSLVPRLGGLLDSSPEDTAVLINKMAATGTTTVGYISLKYV